MNHDINHDPDSIKTDSVKYIVELNKVYSSFTYFARSPFNSDDGSVTIEEDPGAESEFDWLAD